jgi:hypothetical protein
MTRLVGFRGTNLKFTSTGLVVGFETDMFTADDIATCQSSSGILVKQKSFDGEIPLSSERLDRPGFLGFNPLTYVVDFR